MRTIIHISDLHFGSADPKIVTALQRTIIAMSPDAVVVSGDLTQRAKTIEFTQAAEFLRSLPNVKVVVPGNHDISLYNVWRRFFRPLSRFDTLMRTEPETDNSDDEVTIIGVNTARSLTIKDGRMSERQIRRVEELLRVAPETNIKIIVTHHPLITMKSDILERLMGAGAQLFLSGHLHVSGSREIAKRYKDKDHTALLLQAGTATSIRYRNEPNSFNVILTKGPEITVQPHVWDVATQQFVMVNAKVFKLNK